jgi:hypothetical protein
MGNGTCVDGRAASNHPTNRLKSRFRFRQSHCWTWPDAFLLLLLARLKVLMHKGERVMGIEPTYQAWEARVLPLNYTREAKRQVQSVMVLSIKAVVCDLCIISLLQV